MLAGCSADPSDAPSGADASGAAGDDGASADGRMEDAAAEAADAPWDVVDGGAPDTAAPDAMPDGGGADSDALDASADSLAEDAKDADPVCMPDSFRCDGTVLEQCNGSLTGFELVADCAPFACHAALGQCGVCAPGTKSCADESTQRACAAGAARCRCPRDWSPTAKKVVNRWRLPHPA